MSLKTTKCEPRGGAVGKVRIHLVSFVLINPADAQSAAV